MPPPVVPARVLLVVVLSALALGSGGCLVKPNQGDRLGASRDPEREPPPPVRPGDDAAEGEAPDAAEPAEAAPADVSRDTRTNDAAAPADSGPPDGGVPDTSDAGCEAC